MINYIDIQLIGMTHGHVMQTPTPLNNGQKLQQDILMAHFQVANLRFTRILAFFTVIPDIKDMNLIKVIFIFA